jgi:uncharacterized protein YggE
MRKYIVLTVIAMAAIMLAACSPAIAPAVVGNSNQPAPRTINVNGTGMVSVTPDIAYISIGVHTEADTAEAAVALNNTQTQKVVDAIKAQGVPDKDIQTNNFSIYPNQKYDDTGKPQGTTYVVDNTVNVTVHDLTKMGEMLDAAVKAGANNVNSVQFDVEDKTNAMSDARVAAVKDAQRQAEELAQAAGVTLGDVQTISYYDNTPIPYYSGKGGGGVMAADAASVPVNPGTTQLTATVNMIYLIK